jgi:hypothetical protein
MIKDKLKQSENSEVFEKRTFQEVIIWDWLARILPLSVLASIAICHFFKWTTALDLIIEGASIAFFIICFVWWYWAIYKIALTAKYIHRSQEKFKDIGNEIKQFKKDLFPP